LTAEGVALAEDEDEVVVVFLGVVAGFGVGFSAAVLYRDLGGEAATTGAGLIGSAIENVLTGGCCCFSTATVETGGALVDFVLFTKLASLFCGAGAAATGDAAGTGVTAAEEEEATTDALPESICFPTPANLAFRNCSPIVDIFEIFKYKIHRSNAKILQLLVTYPMVIFSYWKVINNDINVSSDRN